MIEVPRCARAAGFPLHQMSNTKVKAATPQRIRSLLVANRGEIAIRVMRAASELGLRTVAIYSQEDRFSLHRTKADEAYLVGRDRGPVEAYLDIADILRVAREAQVEAIHPGYGFLAENPELADACAQAGIVFIGPEAADHARARQQGERARARGNGGRGGDAGDGAAAGRRARVRAPGAAVGYPLMLKASWGGGGRGTRVVRGRGAARRAAAGGAARGAGRLRQRRGLPREARAARASRRGADPRRCARKPGAPVRARLHRAAPPPEGGGARAGGVPERRRSAQALCAAALAIGRAARYRNAGTVEFLQDADSGRCYFIEVNPRIQVEHTVTEAVTGIDLVKAQIRIADGARIGTPESGVPAQADIRVSAHALQCRITTEDPENNFIPDYGKIAAYRSPAGFGIRLDAGTAYTGAIITRSYDSLLVKVTAWAPTPEETIARMHRALWEFRIRGVVTNLRFLDQLITHPRFASGDYTTRFIDETPELFQWPRKRDRATRILSYLGATIVNGNPEVQGRARPARSRCREAAAGAAAAARSREHARSSRQLGPDAFAQWMLAEQRVLLTDTTMRDAHQSLLATRMRTIDMTAIAPYYASLLPQLFSVECWGGATFDVAMRFLREDPWQRLAQLRELMPNLLLQMLLRGANAVGYTSYPDNVVRFFVARAAEAGIDVFRIFDSLNWVENMRVSIDAVLRGGQAVRGGHLLHRET